MKTDIKKLILKDKKQILLIQTSKSENDALNEAGNALKSGIKIIIFYNKNISDNLNATIAKKLHQLCSFYEALFLIYKRTDIAKIIDCDGVFLDKNSITTKQASQIISEEKFIFTNYKDENSDLYIEVEINDNNCENKIFRI